jgi:sucrose phosphorylase
MQTQGEHHPPRREVALDGRRISMAAEAVLITYPNRLAPSLSGLRDLLRGPLSGLFAGVHVLPFFTPVDGADAGFDPIDHRRVDPRIGSWDDVRRLADDTEVWADLIVNHVSDSSPAFLDFAEHGDASPYAGMFHTFDRVFPTGAREADLLAVFRPRPGLPFTVKTIAGRPRLLWTTFTERQVDLDLTGPTAWAYLEEVLTVMAAHGVRHVRLDAVGYVAKTPGTSCFLTPDTYRHIDRLTDFAHGLGLDVLAEVHAHHRRQLDLGHRVDRFYDFALPPLVLHAVHAGDVAPLLGWLVDRPANTVTVLDTHDGIGVMDVGEDALGGPDPAGLLTPAQIDALVEAVHRASLGTSELATGRAASNLDLYQVNCTWYDALGQDDARMVLTRLIQLFAPGIPHVYYTGLLAGANDLDLLARTGVGRDVNRHRYTAAEVDAALHRPVVAATATALRLRNTHPAFDGRFSCGRGPGPGSLRMRWSDGLHEVLLDAVPGTGTFRLTASTPTGDPRGEQSVSSVAELARLRVPAPQTG